ncbi:DNA-directed RNA polymerase specialized sigma subunit, sigma24 family [Parapedobacter composti]|uniref:DNA-directed RNA polymerase specialized sigma subunit, sigma24 family n=1 Tax=Parapedobacter composti TaxID=623281 RepID=A0A1I1EEH7_9SPHI|nr:sigma-70 family RNA polymerase sigma factor [Parapedobacter composti]SFB85574.1 DNA-directed RNA polymerase specialized sigma subunit, sigma24 family [Parapedobacter composti]
MKIIEKLYERIFPAVARHVAGKGGSLEEAKDVFHDALLVYVEKTRSGTSDMRQSEAYVFGVARYLWIKRYKENLRYASLDQLMAGYDQEDPGAYWTQEFQPQDELVSSGRVFRLLQAAGRKCMDVLAAFYYEKLDMQELANRFGFAGTRSATVQKFKCLQKVKQVVKEKSLRYEDFVG